MLRPRDDEDWFPHSKLEVSMEIVFMWELYGFRDQPGRKSNWPMGAEVPGTLVGPHINTSDWLVQYPRYDSGSLIHRVVNERQMRLPSGEAASSLR
jgi:hypothetical protein